ncbi:MAG: radical SAM protein [Candidatus Micrarchaeia archaeon]
MTLPKTVVWDVTSRCLLNCRFCFAKKQVGNELSTKEAKKFISRLKGRNVKTLVFSGGDPLCRKDLAALLEHAKEDGLKTILHTTGLASQAKLEEILPFVDRINLPLDGPPHTHAKMRGSDKHFDAVIETLKFLRKKSVAVSITTMVSKKNACEVLDVAKTIKKFDNISLWRLLEFRAEQRGAKHAEEFELKSGEFAEVEKKVRNLAKKENWKKRLQFVSKEKAEFDQSYTKADSSGNTE